MYYDLNQLGDPKRFQRLVTAILRARFGENLRITPIQGPDGGSDGETAPGNPYMEFRYDATSLPATNPLVEPPHTGCHLFQAKYHRTGDRPIAELRTTVVREFRQSLEEHVLRRPDRDGVNYFFLITNVPSSKTAYRHVDDVRKTLLSHPRQLHADVWWAESLNTFLDWSHDLWPSFPELFPGRVPPLLALMSDSPAEHFETFRLAAVTQRNRDRIVKFRQIELEQHLNDLFVDLDVAFHTDDETLLPSFSRWFVQGQDSMRTNPMRYHRDLPSALQLLIDDNIAVPRLLLEGGPGQGKSTVTQMAAQIYREKLLKVPDSTTRDPSWQKGSRLRVPVRVELRHFALWMADTDTPSLERYIAHIIAQDSGGSRFTVRDLRALVRGSPVILFLDGLDEIGNDSERDRVLDAIVATCKRFEEVLKTDLRVVVTTRPPAVAGRRGKLDGFVRVDLVPLNAARIEEYRDRWLATHIKTEEDKKRIRLSFDRRRNDSHVEALARNPMQLSVLLQFIYLKGEAFPDRRAELYREYFAIVIDRDVEKRPELREVRGLVEGLHAFLGFRIHGMTEIKDGRRSLNRRDVVRLARQWLVGEGENGDLADRYFRLGEERFGLIVARSGEGQDTAYGFEVQPIQEYFAGAYISDQLDRKYAHEIFERLVHRSYWREVALFLAGLRRPNEKADLVGRAKAADKGLKGGGRQPNGRLMVLQLMREGVLTRPKHVLTEALNFVMELLDVKTLQRHSNPHALMRELSHLAARFGGESTHREVENMVRAHWQSRDGGLLGLIHRMAATVLPRESYMDLIVAYEGTMPELRALIRLSCLYRSVRNVEELGSSAEYWAGIPAAVFGRAFWRAAVDRGVVADIVYPRGAHLPLITQFAIDHRRRDRPTGRVLVINSDLAPGIWRLERNMQTICRWDVGGESSGQDDSVNESGFRSTPSWDDESGEHLPHELKQCLGDLIDLSDALVLSLGEGRKGIRGRRLVAYLRGIRAHLEDGGLSGWVAARCAIDLVRSPILQRAQPDSGVPREMKGVRDGLMALYDLGGEYSYGVWHPEELASIGMPLGLRLGSGGAPRRIEEVIAQQELGGLGADERAGIGWLRQMPIPRAVIRPLVELCREDVAGLLRMVGERGVRGRRFAGRLRVQDTQRILKICRQTDDRRVLMGAAEVMTQASFVRIAEVDLVVRLLSAAPSSILVHRVLNVSSEAGMGRQFGLDERQMAENASRCIVERQDEHPFYVVNRALAVLREGDVDKTTPLFEVYPDMLGLG